MLHTSLKKQEMLITDQERLISALTKYQEGSGSKSVLIQIAMWGEEGEGCLLQAHYTLTQ